MKTNKKALEDLFDAFAKELQAQINTGETPAATLNVIRQFLKDQGVNPIPGTNPAVNNIASTLPFNGEEHEEDPTYN